MKTKSIILVVSLALMVTLFAGCNMLRGAGRDLENAGDSVARGVERTGDAIARGLYDRDEDRDTAYRRDRTLGNINGITDYGTGYVGGIYENSLLPNTSMARTNIMGVNHLVSLMGMNENDLNLALGTGRNMTTGTGKTFTHSLYGANTDIDVDFDDNNSIRQIKVYVDNDRLARWQNELNNRYGTPTDATNVMWNANRANIKMNPGVDRTEIIFTRPVV